MDSVVSATIEVTLEKLLAIATEEFNLVWGFKQDLANLTDSLLSIKAVLEDADRRQVTDEAVKLWLKKLEDVAYDADNVLDEIKYENLRRTVQIRNQMKPKVCLYFSFYTPLAFLWKMAHKIKNINVNLKRINDKADRRGFERRVAESAPSRPLVKETDAITADPVFVGRQNDESKFVEKITGRINEVFPVLLIVGMGGIGKTTLACRIFNHPHTQTHFDETIKSILESLKETSHGDSRQAVMDTLREKLKDKRCLLVLDDLWNEKPEDWDDLKNTLMGVEPNKGNVISVTTRNESVASIVNPHNWYNLEKLSEDDCWSIIKAKAFEGGDIPEHFQTIGKAIAQQCRGSPLASKMMGAVLRGKEIDEHLTILEESTPEITKEKASYVRTLVSKSSVACKNFQDFNHLRILVLCNAGIKDCPTSSGKLIHLRCLDVSNNEITTVPSSVCKLYNLPTFKTIDCYLEQLPEKLQDLTSFRHLYYCPNEDFPMPPQIRRLSFLQTLQFFNVSDKEGCRIEELGHLNNLRGKIEIRNVELVNSTAEAKKANLSGKTTTIMLKFCWRNTNEGNTTYESVSESDMRNENVLESKIHDQSVLEGLQPHPNLRIIGIEGFRGKNFPLWTMKMLKLDKLIKIELRN
ncbi:putative disease resistance RPP13-like protein 1 [Forsythia ovata]|uniref:Disease resistance RPP13-like protein 1 n=1 Tax=Forsythia ovata TaxID=205694 RepID=A0ABD1UYR9_9LAMI